MRTAVILLALLGPTLGCGGDDVLERRNGPHALTIWNSTQRPLEEVRIHEETAYLGTANRLDVPLENDGRTQVQIFYGQRVTVIRRNVDGGQRIAFTTAAVLPIDGPGYVLQVFQESFRLHEPDLADGQATDGGGDPGGGDPGGDPGGGDTGGDP